MESIETLNQRLIDKYGKYLDGQAMFHLVFASDIKEKQLRTHSPEGFQYVSPRIEEVPKYPWLNGKYVLEGLKEVPILFQGQFDRKITYEPMWVFEDGNGNPVPPVWVGIEHILESVRCAMEGNNAKEEDPNDALNDPKTAYEAREKKLKDIQDALWPNETQVGDALAYKEAIVVPRNYTKES